MVSLTRTKEIYTLSQRFLNLSICNKSRLYVSERKNTVGYSEIALAIYIVAIYIVKHMYLYADKWYLLKIRLVFSLREFRFIREL